MSSYKQLVAPLDGEPIVSSGNTKVGRAANVSLLPGVTCPRGVPCRRKCYACRSLRLYREVRAGWSRNTRLARNPPLFMAGVARQLLEAKSRGRLPAYFRWHIGGDFPSLGYMRLAVRLAAMFPAVRFMAFTKRYRWAAQVAAELPPNFALILSAWPGRRMCNPAKLPTAWAQDGTETRIPAGAVACPGQCDGCRQCWAIGETPAKAVVFTLH